MPDGQAKFGPSGIAQATVFGMAALVQLKRVQVGVGLATLQAAIGFLTGVAALVRDEMRRAVETLATGRTSEGTLPGVNSLVDLKVEMRGECLATLVTP